MTSNPFLVIGVMVALGAATRFLRLWTQPSGKGSARQARLSRISQHDDHLSFEERIAERMRELAQEKSDGSAGTPHRDGPLPPSRSFGRRQA